ncbi:MAG: YraN family protein [Planctomycetes bacterium]|nr:YraN family protein [Planctomycetota bacterium]
MQKKTVGSLGEDAAIKYLKKQGYRIVERNFRCNFGEIDIIAYRKEVLSFIEVKTRTSAGFGMPEESITPAKQKRMLRLAKYYLYKKKVIDKIDCRFDAVTVLLPTAGAPQISLLENVLILGYESKIR